VEDVMTDLELTEMAAKAHGGIQIERDNDGWTEYWCSGNPWNPLTDDGDALRLAVKLRIDTGFVGQQVAANMAVQGPGGDIYANTRRAIVRAAAEIGRMK
jgi:hypothetical protein